jgi:hypothetical protein
MTGRQKGFYSETQRAEILRAVRDGCAQPMLFNLDHADKCAGICSTSYTRYVSNAVAVKRWKRVARCMKEARSALIEADLYGYHSDQLRPDEEGIPCSFLECLRTWESFADETARSATRDGYSERPSLLFFDVVLDLWLSAGGGLSYSRDPNSRILKGPLIRYLEASVRPVMGEQTPSRESLRLIIDRMRAHMERVVCEHPKIAGFYAAIQCGETERSARRKKGLRLDAGRARLLIRGGYRNGPPVEL